VNGVSPKRTLPNGNLGGSVLRSHGHVNYCGPTVLLQPQFILKLCRNAVHSTPKLLDGGYMSKHVLHFTTCYICRVFRILRVFCNLHLPVILCHGQYTRPPLFGSQYNTDDVQVYMHTRHATMFSTSLTQLQCDYFYTRFCPDSLSALLMLSCSGLWLGL